MSDAQHENERHKQKMEKRKAFQDKLVEQAPHSKHLLMVYTGKGKGKSTAAFGTILRALGHGYKVGVVQFIKGAWATGEQQALQHFDHLVTYEVGGEGFTWETQDRARDIEKARQTWDVAMRMLQDPSYHLLLLDELNIVLRYDYLPMDEVIAALQARKMHVIVTGRNAPPALVEAADLVTEMQLIKHPFREQGIKAQAGIEF